MEKANGGPEISRVAPTDRRSVTKCDPEVSRDVTHVAATDRRSVNEHDNKHDPEISHDSITAYTQETDRNPSSDHEILLLLPPPQFSTFQRIPLFDKRERLPDNERENALNTVDEVLKMILEEGNDLSDESTLDEMKIAQMMADIQTAINRTKFALGQLKPTSEISSSAQIHSDLQASEDEDAEATLLESEFQNAEATLLELEKLKLNILRKGMSECLEPSGKHGVITKLQEEACFSESPSQTDYGLKVAETVRELALLIQEELFQQKHILYTRDAFITFVYEFVYTAYLWRKEIRKDYKSSTFLSHLKEAVKQHIRHGLTALPRLISALKHDDLENLPFHQPDFNPQWLFCSPLYVEKLGSDTSEQYPLPAAKYLERNIKYTSATVRAVTNPDQSKAEELPMEERLRRDEARLIRLWEQILENGYAATLKILEQVQNAQTITFLGDERADEKLAPFILRHYAVMAKILELKEAYKGLVGPGIDRYRPELREWFNTIQRERNASERPSLLARLSLGTSEQHADSHDFLTKSRFPEFPLSPEHDSLTKSRLSPEHDLPALVREYTTTFDHPSEEIAREQSRIRERIYRIFIPTHSDIVSVDIVPTSLEEYIDVRQLIENPDYIPQIHSSDPLFEVVVLVKSEEAMEDVASNILQAVHAQDYSKHSLKEIPGHPVYGIQLHLVDDAFGGEVRIRVNNTRDEARSKRGVHLDRREPIPCDIRERIKFALREAQITRRPVLDVIEKIVLQNYITVTTDAKHRDRFILPEGACVLDLAAALPGDIGVETFMRAEGARLTRTQPDGSVVESNIDLLGKLRQGDLCRILTGSEHKLDLGLLPFCASVPDKWQRLIRKHFRGAEQKIRMQDNISRAEQYLPRLNHLYGITDSELLTVLSLDLLDDFGIADKKTQEILLELKDLFDEERSGNFVTNPRCAHSGDSVMKPRFSDELTNALSGHFQTFSQGQNRDFREQFLRRRRILLNRIGVGNFDPLKALARYVDRSAPYSATFLLKNIPGAYESVSNATARAGINIEKGWFNPNQDKKTSTTCMALSFPDAISNHEVLKFFLGQTYNPFVIDVQLRDDLNAILHAQILAPPIFRFPDYISILLGKANEWTAENGVKK